MILSNYSNKISSVNFTSQQNRSDNDDKKQSAKKVVEGGGAVAAATAITKRPAMDMFAAAGKASGTIKKGADTINLANNAIKQTSSLWSKCAKACSSAKNFIIRWGETVKASKYIAPLLKSRMFKCCAGFMGYGFGAITLINGLADIVQNISTSLTSMAKIKN